MDGKFNRAVVLLFGLATIPTGLLFRIFTYQGFDSLSHSVLSILSFSPSVFFIAAMLTIVSSLSNSLAKKLSLITMLFLVIESLLVLLSIPFLGIGVLLAAAMSGDSGHASGFGLLFLVATIAAPILYFYGIAVAVWSIAVLRKQNTPTSRASLIR